MNPIHIEQIKFYRLIIFLLLLFTQCQNSDFNGVPISDSIEKSVSLTDYIDSISYFTGIYTALNLKDMDYNQIDVEMFYRGLKDAFNLPDSVNNKYEADFILGLYFDELRKIQAQNNLVNGQEFLKKNCNRDGIVTTSSGLQYKIDSRGTGPKPNRNSVVIANIVGKLIENIEFTNAYQAGKPDTFYLQELKIPGLVEAFLLMNAGSKYTFYLPSELAFGNSPPPFYGLKPNMVVKFDIELLEIISVKH